MIFGIVLNITAGAGAFMFGFLDDRIGAKSTIQLINSPRIKIQLFRSTQRSIQLINSTQSAVQLITDSNTAYQ